jgi:N6-adenosine-specific RNA methylase IME4
MKLENIKALKVPSADNAVLYLWATAPKMEEAMQVMMAWGFDYRTCMVWDKEIIGMGYWFRGQHEILLVGVKGKFSPPIPKYRVSSMLRHRRGQHSRKPAIVRDWIRKWFPQADRVELFAREKTLGWDVWGNEIDSDIELGIEE